MKLQFAFGNPRPKKAKKTKKKGVAVKSKNRKNKSIAKHSKSSVKKGTIVAKKAKRSKSKSRKTKTKKNPVYFQARKNGKLIGGGKFATKAEIGKKYMKPLAEAKKRYAAAPAASKAKAKARAELAKTIKAYSSQVKKNAATEKDKQRYEQDGAKIKMWETTEGEGKPMAKRKKKKAKKASKKVARKAKKATKRKAAKKVVRKAKRKSSKRRSKKAKKVMAVAAPKKARRSKKSRKARKHRYPKMTTHKHSASTRHLKKGTKFKFKSTSGKGKKKVSVFGSFKINPFRSNPMKKVGELSKDYLNMDLTQVGALALGGALVPVVNAGIGKIPGMDKVVGLINSYLGPQATGSAIPVLAGVLLNAAGEHLIKDAKTREYVKMAGEGLAAAGIIGFTMGLSQQYVVPQMAGVLFTPGMNGINYTPMSGINYTPMSGVPQLGIMPTMGDGYTEAHKFSRADFGRGMGGADFGKSMGSGADFGRFALDQDADEMSTDDDIIDENLSGSMG